MTFLELLLMVALPTALLTSVMTAALIYYLAQKLYDKKIEKKIDALPDRISAAVQGAGEKLLPEFEARVKRGFLTALKDSAKLGPEMTVGVIESALQGIDQFIGGGRKDRR